MQRLEVDLERSEVDPEASEVDLEGLRVGRAQRQLVLCTGDKTRTNNAILPLAGDGGFAISPFVIGNGTVDVVVDVFGYFE